MLLILDLAKEPNFKKEELFNSRDIFTEVVADYDDGFLCDYNIIKPAEELRKSLLDYSEKNDSLFNSK